MSIFVPGGAPQGHVELGQIPFQSELTKRVIFVSGDEREVDYEVKG